MSTNTSHTPGPWKVKRQFIHGREIVPRIVCAPDDDRQCGWIADLIGAPYLGHHSTLANARLIAAAPDLLEACKAALAVLDGSAKDDVEPGAPSGAAMNLIAAAIEKATGPDSGTKS